ncbi:hypothetical protein D3C84_1301360 [compost metagenome]
MDRLEGFRGSKHPANFYDRVRVCDLEKDIVGYAYVWNHSKGLPEIHSGSWKQHAGGDRIAN